jgi:anti-sigma factor ChrR (cupin superfamily)
MLVYIVAEHVHVIADHAAWSFQPPQMNGMMGMTSTAQASAPQASAGQRLMAQELAPQ